LPRHDARRSVTISVKASAACSKACAHRVTNSPHADIGVVREMLGRGLERHVVVRWLLSDDAAPGNCGTRPKTLANGMSHHAI